jgi:tRNA G10  N-methylase Trm11
MVHKSVFILGRQPAISRAELESLFGGDHIEAIGEYAAGCDIAPEDIDFARIGSSIRIAVPLATIPTIKWPEVSKQVPALIPEILTTLPGEGKVKLGLSVFDLGVQANHLLRTGLELKKACKAAGRSVRVVPNTELALNTAQVVHNQLTGSLGVELLLIKHGNTTYVARTVAIQDIQAYAHRDQGRPKRDAFVGMLPPKLAQTIVNLAAGPFTPSKEHVILDPFCGTGVVLQEALLMGYGVYGTDLEPRMIDYSRQNLEWLQAQRATPATFELEAGDATDYRWEQPFTSIACETYLGRPLSNWPKPEKLREIIGTCNVIVQKFMANIADQIPPGTRLCLAVPAWQSPEGRLYHLPLLDQLEVLGYNRVSFLWASEQEMVYRRPDQLVARELLVITRK